MPIPINYLAVAVSALASLGLGFLWYGPLFGKQWMALQGLTPERIEQTKAAGRQKTYLIALLGAVVMAITLALRTSQQALEIQT